MRLLFFISTFILSLSPAHAEEDVISVFYTPEKVIVLINEINGAPRLNGFMDAVGAKDTFIYESADKSLGMTCGRNSVNAACAFTLAKESHLGKFDQQKVEALVPRTELNLQSDYEMTFESPIEDRFHLKVDGTGLWYLGTKKY